MFFEQSRDLSANELDPFDREYFNGCACFKGDILACRASRPKLSADLDLTAACEVVDPLGDAGFFADRCVRASERAVFSYGVKSTNQLYHDEDVIGYKTVVLRDISVAEFVSMENISANFENVTGGYSNYENE